MNAESKEGKIYKLTIVEKGDESAILPPDLPDPYPPGGYAVILPPGIYYVAKTGDLTTRPYVSPEEAKISLKSYCRLVNDVQDEFEWAKELATRRFIHNLEGLWKLEHPDLEGKIRYRDFDYGPVAGREVVEMFSLEEGEDG